MGSHNMQFLSVHKQMHFLTLGNCLTLLDPHNTCNESEEKLCGLLRLKRNIWLYKLSSFNKATYPEAVSFIKKSVPVPSEVACFFSRSQRSAGFAKEV